tara:strand:+ start:86 stop:298 length:213 start_codon:yes stop_codon:yes gene_type:complete
VLGDFKKDKYIKIVIGLLLLLKLIFSLARLYISIKSTRRIRNIKINKTNKIFFKYILIKYEKRTFGNKLL